MRAETGQLFALRESAQALERRAEDTPPAEEEGAKVENQAGKEEARAPADARLRVEG